MDGRQRRACAACGAVAWLDPKLVAVAVVVRDRRLLFVRRASDPGMGLWSLPGGYVDRGEVVEEAVRREVREETGLEVEAESLLGLYSEAGNPVAMAVYLAREVGGTVQLGVEVQAAGFYPADFLPPLAFSRDQRVVDDWLKLQRKA
ncbi:MAG: NUDIX domain-containing protein [Chloroflexi bacterium]|nr:NUDIX domain-containing protein [Chloroflexota bacterium]